MDDVRKDSIESYFLLVLVTSSPRASVYYCVTLVSYLMPPSLSFLLSKMGLIITPTLIGPWQGLNKLIHIKCLESAWPPKSAQLVVAVTS